MKENPELFNQIVENDSDIIGLIAHGIHLHRKQELKKDKSADTLASYDETVNIDDLKKRANELLDEVYSERFSQKLQEGVSDAKQERLESRLDDLEERLSSLEPVLKPVTEKIERIHEGVGLYPWGKSILTSVISGILVPFLLFLLLLAYQDKAIAILKELNSNETATARPTSD